MKDRNKDPEHDPERTLPVTAELGDEGGSYGDATMQAETFAGAPGNPRVDRDRVAAAGREAGAAEPAPPREADVRHATQPPDDEAS